ncbi:Aste57867_14355 [Aphanomyces stellatus]|uniref:Aste57867_14355 protein n=1 Tax=Aphanomyces stellatus TaxID=120398 RepID=A0A485L104_9STRA|nr:hypothetical protein As57867_014301 [Aphanomyces stellatus]VFT91179.1 Aste57867_14355 [Aphanomyces stellatus]
MGLQDRKRAAAALRLAPPLQRPTTQRSAALTNQEIEQLRIDLEDILTVHEPAKVGSASDLLKQYEGLELELVECYRYYYTKDGEPLELVVDMQQSTLCPPPPPATNNQDDQHDANDDESDEALGGQRRRHSFAQVLRNRLSLPKPAIATYLNAKLLAKFQKKQGKPPGSKMEGIRGPEVPPPPRSPSPKRAPLSSSGFRLQTKASLANLMQRVVRGKPDVNPFEVKARHRGGNQRKPTAAPQQPFEVRCLDTGEALKVEHVNHEVMQHKKDLAKRKTFRDKVVIFLQKHDMAAVTDVDDILNFGGKTNEDIWEDLQVKYKVNQRSRLLQLFQKYDPARIGDVDDLLEDYADRVEEMIRYYKERYTEKRRTEQTRSDPCTWSPGQANSYQLLPGGQ